MRHTPHWIRALRIASILAIGGCAYLVVCLWMAGGWPRRGAAGDVWNEMLRLETWMESGYEAENELPPDNLADVVQDWESAFEQSPHDPAGPSDPQRCPYLRRGEDPWGSPFVYQVDVTRRPTVLIAIRSFGPNKQDEQGSEDDIERQFDLVYNKPVGNRAEAKREVTD